MSITFGFEFEFQRGPDSIREALEDYDWECDCEACREHEDYFELVVPGIPALLLKEDGSVEGGEITTKGGQSIDGCLKLFGQVLSLGSWRVDTECSFHIHVGDTNFGMRHSRLTDKEKHTYQAEALTYLLLHWEEWPLACRLRFLSDAREDYFSFRFGRGKMSGIRIHPQGTMEYRLWGNIKSVEEAEAALRLTERAHRHALLVLSGGKGLWRPHMHTYFAEGQKGVEWILGWEDVITVEFNWQAFYKRGRRWSDRVLADLGGARAMEANSFEEAV